MNLSRDNAVSRGFHHPNIGTLTRKHGDFHHQKGDSPGESTAWENDEVLGVLYFQTHIYVGLSINGYPKFAGWFISGKIPSFDMDDDWGYLYFQTHISGPARSYSYSPCLIPRDH